jgi:hypothetical protein
MSGLLLGMCCRFARVNFILCLLLLHYRIIIIIVIITFMQVFVITHLKQAYFHPQTGTAQQLIESFFSRGPACRTL